MMLFGDIARRYAEMVENGGMLVATGIVSEDTERGIGLTVQRIQPLVATSSWECSHTRAEY
jgi:hypothetical protein